MAWCGVSSSEDDLTLESLASSPGSSSLVFMSSEFSAGLTFSGSSDLSVVSCGAELVSNSFRVFSTNSSVLEFSASDLSWDFGFEGVILCLSLVLGDGGFEASALFLKKKFNN